MFEFFKRSQYLTRELEQRDKVIKSLGEENQNLKQNHQTQQEQEVSDAEFSVDWQRMRAFAIERNIKDNKICTIIGYFKTDKDGNDCVSEWYLFCNAETHRRLVAEFDQYRSA